MTLSFLAFINNLLTQEFRRDHSEEGPAGPSAFWKISNEISNDFTGHVDGDYHPPDSDDEDPEDGDYYEEELEEGNWMDENIWGCWYR